MASTRSIKTYGGRRRKKLPSPPHPLLDREDFLDPEHESVEPVDPDNNNDDDDYRQDNEEDPIYDEDEDEDMGPVTRRRARLRPEVQDADEHLRNPQLRRLKRNKHIDWDEDDDQEFAEADTPGPRTETSTLADIEQGGLAEATVRMLHLLTKARGYVRRTRLERELLALKRTELFPELNEDSITKLLHIQSLIVDYAPKQAISTLTVLLNTSELKKVALELVMDIAGPRETMHPAALKQFQEFEGLLS
jgi:hypothetical protein